MRQKKYKSLRLALVLISIGFFGGAAFANEAKLDKIHKKIERDFANVEHIDADSFAALDPDEIIVFDVRQPSEYAVSHIDGAIRVDPGASADDFIAAHGDFLAGKTAVFYCSVGRRSSAFAARVDNMLTDHGVQASYNLQGGLFSWSNDGRALMQDAEATTAIHPYNAYWGRLIVNKETIQYTPVPKE